MEDEIIDQTGCFENTRDFPSEEIPLGYRLRSPLHLERNHARSTFLTVFSNTQPDHYFCFRGKTCFYPFQAIRDASKKGG
jgi:hypothetical protein